MRISTLLVLLVFLSLFLQAQQIKGTVGDDQGKPLSGASTILKRTKDSSIVKLGLSSGDGSFGFSGIPAGSYFVTVTHIGYKPFHTSSFTIGTADGSPPSPQSLQLPGLSLTRTDTGLKGALVTSNKPLVEVKADKIILHVEGSINAIGQDALELLRKSPGVTVDKDNNLSVNGKNGVQVFIDGHPSPLAGSNLAEYLKTLQSSSIESIEIIANPSARYEAAGNAGIINIRLKKDHSLGNNATIGGGYNIGTYSKYNGNLSFNHRDKHVNIFGSYTYTHNLSETFLDLYRTQLDTLFDGHSTVHTHVLSHNLKTGFDYFIDTKNTLGLAFTGNFSNNRLETSSETPISYIPSGQVDRILVANNSSSPRRRNGNLNLNYRYSDTSGVEWTMDADLGLYRVRNEQQQPNDYYDTGMDKIDSNYYDILSPGDIRIFSWKSDYGRPLAGGRLELGMKTSFITSDNDFTQYQLAGNSRFEDSLQSNHFFYRENINALYANYSRPFKGWNIQAGIRIENTNNTGRSTGYIAAPSGPGGGTGGGGNSAYIAYDSGIDRHYTDLFPSASITFNKDPKRQWTLNYSRRIDRPAYQDLNPFEFRLDDYTFQKGNTGLRPQYTNSVGLTFIYKSKLTATLNYSSIGDLFTQLADTTEGSKAVIYKQNLALQHILSLNFNYPFQYKWYSLFANISSYYSRYDADFGPGHAFQVDEFNCTIYTQHSFRFGKGWTGEITQYYTSPSFWAGTLKARSLSSVDLGLQKTVLKGNGTAKVSVSDIFYTLHWSATSDFAGQFLRTTGRYESRLLKLYFTYRFGNKQLRSARQRKPGDDEESKRAGNQGGGLGNTN